MYIYILFCILLHYGVSRYVEHSSLLYSRTSLFTHPVYNGLHVLTLSSLSTPSPAPSPPTGRWQPQACPLGRGAFKEILRVGPDPM